jgi:hypothetical protein
MEEGFRIDIDDYPYLVFIYTNGPVSFEINYSAFTIDYIDKLLRYFHEGKSLKLKIIDTTDDIYMILTDDCVSICPGSISTCNPTIDFKGTVYVEQMINSFKDAKKLLIKRKI